MRRGEIVSIPFIAGQWSLLADLSAASDEEARFQSPSLRGSGRFVVIDVGYVRVEALFQSPSLRGSGRFGLIKKKASNPRLCLNPLHCGAVVASGRRPPPAPPLRVSIPFIAGQWSLRSQCFRPSRPHRVVSIPFIAGQWSLRGAAGGGMHHVVAVSIPFIAGQWSLPPTSPRRAHPPSSLNPLHCGAVVASGS